MNSEDAYFGLAIICAISFVLGMYCRNKELEGPDPW